ncbi:MAG TPA: accessory factor UbiK family protein [Gammaproteobacteria bacterium]|nr:accessory factor UbiK family protein [Gammaproteobacteria bacterium]
MISNQNINDLTEKLTALIPDGVKAIKVDIDQNIKAILETGLRQMNLVSREEFDVQTALLERSLLKLEALEKQIKALEDRN